MLIRRRCLAKCLDKNSLISGPVYEEGALSGFLKRRDLRKGKSRRSTARLIREFAQRNVRKRAPRKAQDFCFFSSNGKEKETIESTEMCTHGSSSRRVKCKFLILST